MENNIETQSLFNPEDGSLPFGYFDPKTEGKLFWICNYDAENNITSIVCYDHGTHQDKKIDYLNSIEDAEKMRDAIIKEGWDKLVPPKVTFNYPGEKEGKPLNRKQRRYLERKIKIMDKNNPYRT